MRSIIQRIATGPELSKDISQQEAERGMRTILDGNAHPVQAAIFLIALRMKRETDDEMRGVLDALLAVTQSVTAEVDEVVDISDPYDGYNRTLPAAPFLPAVLAACGVPAITQGVASMGPKYGCTHRRVLSAAGAAVDLPVQQAAQRLSDPRIGWAYVDQSKFCPALHALTDLRTLVVKRPVLTTIETSLRPISGKRKTHLVSGYVHKPYPRIYALLARHAGFDSALLVRGVEGGIIPSLRQAGKGYAFHDKGEEQDFEINPESLGIAQTTRGVPLPADLPQAARPGDDIAIAVDIDAMGRAAARAGIAALEGVDGPVRDSLILSGALCLHHLRRFPTLSAAANAVRAVLDNGAALARLHAGAV
ncbi:MAG: anthranilate phosphoribosyltransferase [Gammaproteobacteria bacterium]|nr:anthranilate phosphoribosyltransferase [Gammaproteobacteria bacterium]